MPTVLLASFRRELILLFLIIIAVGKSDQLVFAGRCQGSVEARQLRKWAALLRHWSETSRRPSLSSLARLDKLWE